jgi:putative oxidoreductase
MATVKTVALWALSILCASLFLFAGVDKFVHFENYVNMFAEMGYAQWFVVVIGVLEMTGAFLLLVPRVAWVGAGLLAVIMVGAVVTVLRAGKGLEAIVPAVVFVILVLIAYARWPRLAKPST